MHHNTKDYATPLGPPPRPFGPENPPRPCSNGLKFRMAFHPPANQKAPRSSPPPLARAHTSTPLRRSIPAQSDPDHDSTTKHSQTHPRHAGMMPRPHTHTRLDFPPVLSNYAPRPNYVSVCVRAPSHVLVCASARLQVGMRDLWLRHLARPSTSTLSLQLRPKASCTLPTLAYSELQHTPDPCSISLAGAQRRCVPLLSFPASPTPLQE